MAPVAKPADTRARVSRRYFFFGSLSAVPLAGYFATPGTKILIVLIDGFGPEYLERSDMPNLKRMGAAGTLKTGKAMIPTVTNVNNASLVTGSFPAQHGITSNFYYDRKTKTSMEMESADLLLRPTVFEHFAKRGRRTAIVTAKDKVRTLCSRGANVILSAEKPERQWIDVIGKQENMYTPEVNYWTFRAARHVLKTSGVDLMYVSTTDYMMHTYAPGQEPSLAHLHQIDRLLGNMVADHPKLELYLTADHGMNAKNRVLDPTAILARQSIEAQSVSIVKDKHKVHHQDLGGSCYVYLERPADLQRARDVLQAVDGIEEVYDAPAAAKKFYLRQDRIGDLMLLAAKEVAFGDLDTVKRDTMVRTHGSRHEEGVPLLVYGRKADADSLVYNLDLTRKLVF